MTQKKSIAMLASTEDIASLNVYHQLINQWQTTPIKFEETSIYVKEFPHYIAYLLLTKNRSVYCEHIDVKIEAVLNTPVEALIFITKHASKSGRPSFSIHTQGNWDKNELGGNEKEIATCPVVLKHILFLELLKHNKVEGFEVVNECTHHGPSIKVPSMFIEIGSTQIEWERLDAGQVITQSLNDGLTIYSGEADQKFAEKPTIIGLGGTHTCSNFARLISENKALLSHVCPSYAVDTLSTPLITQALQKTTTSNSLTKQPTVVVDWKSLSSHQKEHITQLLSTLNLPNVRLSDLKTKLDST